MKLLKRDIGLWMCCLLLGLSTVAQNIPKDRIQRLRTQLDSLQTSVPGLLKTVDFSITSTELPTFLKAVASTNGVNISTDTSLKNVVLTQSFSDASVKDVLLFLCRQYQLTIEITGNILVVKRHKDLYKPREIPVSYDVQNNLFSIDLQRDSLPRVLKKITTLTGKNLVFTVGLEGKRLNGFIKEKPFDNAIDILAQTNNLKVNKTPKGFYIFESADAATANRNSRPIRPRTANFYFKVKDTVNQLLEVDFIDTPIEAIINDIAHDLKINMATSKPLKNIGKASVKSDSISFNILLSEILEDTKFAFKKENGMYFFGEREKPSVRKTVSIPLMHRSIEMMMKPIQSRSNSMYNNFSTGSLGVNNNQFNNGSNFNNRNNNITSRNNNRSFSNQNRQPFSNYNNDAEALLSLFPKAFTDSLAISTDIEHNSFIVSGDALYIDKFKNFLKEIDKSVPVILIEVMIIEVNKTLSFSAGLDLGIGENPVSDQGTILDGSSGTNLTLGASTINNIIGGLNGFGSANLGKVVPNFYARIQALETNGDIKVRSTPKLSTLNGHTAELLSGVTSYYKVTRTDIIGSQNPQTINTENYIPTEANLSINIRPLISGDENITMSISVVQSSFNNDRIEEDAPPGFNSREFTSTIRVKDQDVIILGGLEENSDTKTGSGVPFLARIPIIKYLFSKRVRTKSDRKLSVLIKPTIIR